MAKTKIQEPIALEFAGFWSRVAAYLIDAVIILVTMTILTPTWGLDIPPFEEITADPVAAFLTLRQFFPLLAVISGLYLVSFWVVRGQTLGKIALNIKLVGRDGECLTIGAAILRFIGYVIAPFTFFFVFIWIFFDRQNQGIHDKFADSYVVKVPDMGMAEPEAGASA
jgi:uncharacterized RDD family membrane protein YckC